MSLFPKAPIDLSVYPSVSLLPAASIRSPLPIAALPSASLLRAAPLMDDADRSLSARISPRVLPR